MIALQSVWIIRRAFELILDTIHLVSKSMGFFDKLRRVGDDSFEQLLIPLNKWKGVKRTFRSRTGECERRLFPKIKVSLLLLARAVLPTCTAEIYEGEG